MRTRAGDSLRAIMLTVMAVRLIRCSPEFALRPYAYAGIHAVLGKVFTLLGFADKVGTLTAPHSVFFCISLSLCSNRHTRLQISVFIMIRCALGAFCAYSEAVFYRGVAKKFGGRFLPLSSCAHVPPHNP